MDKFLKITFKTNRQFTNQNNTIHPSKYKFDYHILSNQLFSFFGPQIQKENVFVIFKIFRREKIMRQIYWPMATAFCLNEGEMK